MAQDATQEGAEAAGFWEGYVPPELPPFVTANAKNALVKSGTPFTIRYIRSGDTEFGSRWYVDCEFDKPVETESGADKTVAQSKTGTFSFNRKGEKSMRDQLLEQLQEYLESHDDVRAKMVKMGKAFTFQPA
jgi:hypothetical protein